MRKTGILAALATSLGASVALAEQNSEGQWGYDHMMWGGGFGMFGGLMMLLFWGAIIFLIVVAVRGFPGGKSEGREPDAMDILKQRFAKGEIDEEEFQKRKNILES